MPTSIAKVEWQECGPVETLKHCWWNLKLIGPLCKSVWWCLLKLNIPKELNTYITKECVLEYP